MDKLFHRSLGREPNQILDYEYLWTPGSTAGSFGRGDIAWPVHGPNWTLCACNDMFQMLGPNNPDPFFVRNGILLFQEGGTAYYLKNAFPPDRTAVRRPGNPFSWMWPFTGCALPDGDSAVLFAYAYVHDSGLDQYTYRGVDATIITGLTGGSPTCTAGQLANLDNSTEIEWTGRCFRNGTHLYIYGVHRDTFTGHVARCVWGSTIATFCSWQYWTGSTWSSAVGDSVAVTIGGPALLEPLHVIPWRGGYLGSAKQLASAPELGYPETPEIFQYYSESPTGPWTFLGNAYDNTKLTGWWSYAAGLVALRGITEPVAQWSLNGGGSNFSVNTYGPHWGPAKPPQLTTPVLKPRIYIP